jgi:hypothetical protein
MLELVIGNRASLPLLFESMLAIIRQLITLAICSIEIADVRENKGNAMPVKNKSANVRRLYTQWKCPGEGIESIGSV